MKLVNRTALIVKPKQPYVDWANSLDDDGPRLSLDDPHLEHNVYLIDEVADAAEADAALRKHFRFIFDHELEGWHLLEEDWPRRRGFKTFQDWFEVEVDSMVIDLSRRYLTADEF